MDTRQGGCGAVGGRQAVSRSWRLGGLVAVVLAGAVMSACGGSAVMPGGALADLEWPGRQVVFRLMAQPLRLEAYSIRGGVAPLGTVPLPLACPQAMVLDAAEGRLWVWGAQGGVAVDGRSLRVVGQWHGNGEGAPPTAGAARPALPVTEVPGACDGGVALARTERRPGP